MLSQNVKKWIMGFILFLVIIAFVFFYGFSKTSLNADSAVVGKINGQPIYYSEFKQKAKNLLETYKEQGNQAEDKEAFNQQIRNMALDSLMQEHFILQKAKKYKIKPSDFEIFSVIARLKTFQREDGSFNEPLFNRYPAYYKNELMKTYGDRLTLQYMQMHFADAGKITDQDLKNYFERKNTLVRVAFVYSENTSDAALGDANALAQNSKIQKFSELLKKGVSFTAAAAKTGLKIHYTDFFSFGGPINGIRTNDTSAKPLEGNLSVYQAAFSLPKGRVSQTLNAAKGQAVLLVLNRKNPDWKKFYTQAISLRNEMMRQSMNDYFSDWFKSSYQNAKRLSFLNKFYRPRT